MLNLKINFGKKCLKFIVLLFRRKILCNFSKIHSRPIALTNKEEEKLVTRKYLQE